MGPYPTVSPITCAGGSLRPSAGLLSAALGVTGPLGPAPRLVGPSGLSGAGIRPAGARTFLDGPRPRGGEAAAAIPAIRRLRRWVVTLAPGARVPARRGAADRAGLEPATSGLGSHRSVRLSYRSGRRGEGPRTPVIDAVSAEVLPTELRPRVATWRGPNPSGSARADERTRTSGRPLTRRLLCR